MASKVKRYYKGQKKNPEEYSEYVGPLGIPEFIESNKQFPLISNLQENEDLNINNDWIEIDSDIVWILMILFQKALAYVKKRKKKQKTRF